MGVYVGCVCLFPTQPGGALDCSGEPLVSLMSPGGGLQVEDPAFIEMADL